MLLALNKHGALHVYPSTEDACRELEAFDVQQEAFEFCDIQGQRYIPTFTRPPKEWRLGPLGFVDVGAFKLVPEGTIDSALPNKFINRATHVEHSSLSAITNIETLRAELGKQPRPNNA